MKVIIVTLLFLLIPTLVLTDPIIERVNLQKFKIERIPNTGKIDHYEFTFQLKDIQTGDVRVFQFDLIKDHYKELKLDIIQAPFYYWIETSFCSE